MEGVEIVIIRYVIFTIWQIHERFGRITKRFRKAKKEDT